MELRSYRAGSMHEALMLVRRELGPDAVVLHTREVRPRRVMDWLRGARQIEVTASTEVNVRSRLPARSAACGSTAPQPVHKPPEPKLSSEVQGQLSHLQQMVEELCRRSHSAAPHDLPESLFRVFAELIDAGVPEGLSRELIERLRVEVPDAHRTDAVLLKARIARTLEDEIGVTGPIAVTPGQRRLVALVGPTGVGKTTTIAKLAANYRLREKHRVGLITVDTYRIAAVEQLRTYADIIDLPMLVVSTPREMRQAVARLGELDLILVDTAGRSPKDELKIQELKAFLTEAAADEVHLVLSSAAGSRTLEETAQRFAAVGTTAIILTKLDEAASLGESLPVIRTSGLPLSYLTNGQNVPDDIETADPRRLVQLVLGEQ